ncbi:MAG: hypothetical protein ACREJB_01415 [Planctomycetaceae bacterium]
MFSEVFYRRRDRMRRVLASRVNQNVRDRVIDGNRGVTRTALCEAVWVVPCRHDAKPIFTEATAAITRDMSQQGLSLIHSGPVTAGTLLVGLECEGGREFLRCRTQHCTPLGGGFYQVGLVPERIIPVSRVDLRILNEQLNRPPALPLTCS